MTDFVKACIKANEEIASKIRDGLDGSLFEKGKIGAGGDISTGIDLFAEEVLVRHLGSFGRIESEESGVIGDGGATIIIDPIDGSSNALSGFPYFGTSIARINENGILDTAIICNLASSEVFIKEGKEKPMQGKLFSEHFCSIKTVPNPEIGLFERGYAFAPLVLELKDAGLKFRSPGATALSLAYAHSVSFFLFAGPSRIYDIVAGLALCEDLEVIVEEEYVIVSQSKDIAKKLEIIVRRSIG